MDNLMGEEVVIGQDGSLAVTIPLYLRRKTDELSSIPGYSITISVDEPTAYLLDLGGENLTLVSSGIIKDRTTNLGEL